jgi:hypothetical protein
VILGVGLMLFPVAAHSELTGYKWPVRSTPFTVAVESHVTDPGVQAALDKAAASWSESSVLDVSIGGSSTQTIVVYEGTYPHRGPGWTELGYKSGDITSATIYVNDIDVPNWSTWWKEQLLCHEMGHSLGLDHQLAPVEPSCISPGWPGTTPNAYDFQELELLYGSGSSQAETPSTNGHESGNGNGTSTGPGRGNGKGPNK